MSRTFGDNIRIYRELKGLRQEDLAFALGYKTKGSINKIENNVTQLPQNKIKQCADILGVPVAKLFSDAEPTVEEYGRFMEYLPYLAHAEESDLKVIRRILGMPSAEKKSHFSFIEAIS